MREKSLREISWQVSEETYREDPALSYSTLATYERAGFNGLESLYDRKETVSLTFGSAVDAIITGGDAEFQERFIVAELPSLSDKATKITKELFTNNYVSCRTLDSISDIKLLECIEKYEYWNNCKAETRIKKLKDEGASDYYDLLYLSENKTLISSEMYADVLASVKALKESESTKDYFAADNPFNDSIEHLYQLKFKASFNGIDYRCMSDLLLVDYEHKVIHPIDLKTSSHTEWEFFKSFIQWNYSIQARLYWRIIRDNLNRDSYFKDFILDDYRFIVVNKTTLTPLVWLFSQTQTVGTIVVDNNPPLKLRDPEDIGKELSYYLKNKPQVPVGIKLTGDNDITEWLQKSYD